MNRQKPLFLLVSLCYTILFFACEPQEKEPGMLTEIDILEDHEIPLLGRGYDFEGNGKDRDTPKKKQLYTLETSDTLDFPIIDAKLVDALRQQLRLLKLRKQKKVQQLGNLEVSLDQLEATIQELLAWQHSKPIGLGKNLEAHQIWGEDRRTNVQFTGYFTPIIKVNKRQTKRYKYPIYTRPKDWEGHLPTRREIEEDGVLDERGLELAYASNKVDIYFMQVQGSGYVQYPNGKQELLSYDGTNKHPYRSIGRYLVEREDIDAKNISMDGIRRFLGQHPELLDTVLFINESYTFFTPKKFQPRGAGHVPLTEDYAIAVDRRYIPLGSCLLALVPIIDPKGKVQRHEWRFLLAQDIGGAIKGAGHVDLYSGIGDTGKDKASALHHYGKMWLLLPKTSSSTLNE